MAETERTYTEREVIKRERTAVMRAVSALWLQIADVIKDDGSWLGSETLARQLYPMPQVERPRVAEDPHSQSVCWRRGGVPGTYGIEASRDGGETWREYPKYETHFFPTASRCAVWSALFAKPTELVDAND